MNSKNVKDIRKQLRNVTQEILPELLKSEVFNGLAEAIETNLREKFTLQLNQINDSVMAQLKQMDERSKDVQAFIMNQVQSELGRTAPSQVVDQNLPDSATLTATEETQPQS